MLRQKPVPSTPNYPASNKARQHTNNRFSVTQFPQLKQRFAGTIQARADSDDGGSALGHKTISRCAFLRCTERPSILPGSSISVFDGPENGVIDGRRRSVEVACKGKNSPRRSVFAKWEENGYRWRPCQPSRGRPQALCRRHQIAPNPQSRIGDKNCWTWRHSIKDCDVNLFSTFTETL